MGLGDPGGQVVGLQGPKGLRGRGYPIGSTATLDGSSDDLKDS